MFNRLFNFGVPLTLVTVYRLVPNDIRGMRHWPGSQGPSSSHLAVSDMWHGINGWTAIRSAILVNGDSTRPKMP